MTGVRTFSSLYLLTVYTLTFFEPIYLFFTLRRQPLYVYGRSLSILFMSLLEISQYACMRVCMRLALT